MLVQFVLLPTVLGTPASCTIQHPFQGRTVELKVTSVQATWNTLAAGYTGTPVRLDFGSSFQPGAHASISPGQGIASSGGSIFYLPPAQGLSRAATFESPALTGALIGTQLTLSLGDYDKAPGAAVGAMASSALQAMVVWVDISILE